MQYATDLNAMVILIDHDKTTSGIDGDSGWTIELTRTVPIASEFPDQLAVLAIDLYTIIGSIADYDVTLIVANQSPRTAEIVRIVFAKVAKNYDIRALNLQLMFSIRETDVAIVVRYRTTARNWLHHLLVYTVIREV